MSRATAALLLSISLSAPLSAQERPSQSGDAELVQAFECRAHLDTWSYIRPEDQRWTRGARRIVAYWTERRDALAREAGLDARSLEMRDLMIPRNPDDLVSKIEQCLRLTPESALGR